MTSFTDQVKQYLDLQKEVRKLKIKLPIDSDVHVELDKFLAKDPMAGNF